LRDSINEDAEGGRFYAFHHKVNPLLTETQPEHNIGKEGLFDPIKRFRHV